MSMSSETVYHGFYTDLLESVTYGDKRFSFDMHSFSASFFHFSIILTIFVYYLY